MAGKECKREIRRLKREIAKLKRIINNAHKVAWQLEQEGEKVISQKNGIERGVWSYNRGMAETARIIKAELTKKVGWFW